MSYESPLKTKSSAEFFEEKQLEDAAILRVYCRSRSNTNNEFREQLLFSSLHIVVIDPRLQSFAAVCVFHI